MPDANQVEREMKRLGGMAELASPRALASSNAYSDPTNPVRVLGLRLNQMDLRGSFLLSKNQQLLRQTEFLFCHNCEIRSQHLEWMLQLHSLRVAQLHGPIAPNFMEFLRVAGQLEHLTFINSVINNEHLSVLQGLSHIGSILFSNCTLDPKAVTKIRSTCPA